MPTPYTDIEGQLALLDTRRTLYLTERGWVSTMVFGVDEPLWEKKLAKNRTIVSTLEVACWLERQMEQYAAEHAADPRFHGPDAE